MADASLDPTLLARSGGACELCGADGALTAHVVGPARPDAVALCERCDAQLRPGATLDAKHWFCLQQAIWSEVPAVQVLAWRLASRLPGEGWARDLLDQAYLDDDLLSWARAGVEAAAEPAAVRVVDSNGTPLADGDSVTLIKDLDVKGASFAAKRGTLVKGIRLGDDPELVEGKVNGIAIYLKTVFLKKV